MIQKPSNNDEKPSIAESKPSMATYSKISVRSVSSLGQQISQKYPFNNESRDEKIVV